MDKNARQEIMVFLKLSGVNKKLEDIEAIEIGMEHNWSSGDDGFEVLKLRIVNEEVTYEKLKPLDFEYDSGYGGQELFGTIWFKDGTWASRREYDGSEWWEYNECPPLPKLKEEKSSGCSSVD